METIFNENIFVHTERNNNPCKIITIEGIDGSGKTTAVELCVEKLKNIGYRAEHFNTSSGYNEYWKVVEELQKNSLINNTTNQILHNIAFLTYLQTEFIDLLNKNDFIISEWYIYGKMVLSELYEDNINSESKELLLHYMNNAKITMPDYSFFISVPTSTSYERILNRKGRIESRENLIMLNKALSIWKSYIKKYNIEMIDGTKNPNQISDLILKKVLK